jgi:hypothetical protein
LIAPAVGQVFDSFELIIAPEVEQALAQQSAEIAEPLEGAEDKDLEGNDRDGGDRAAISERAIARANDIIDRVTRQNRRKSGGIHAKDPTTGPNE